MLTYCLLATAYTVAMVCLGAAPARWLRLRVNLADQGLIGVFTLTLLTLAVHLVMPVQTPMRLLLLALTVASGIWCWRALRSGAEWGVIVGVAVLLSAQPTGLAPVWDTGFYYLQTVRWMEALPVAQGLALVNAWAALGSAVFAMAAVFDVPGWGWVGAHTVNSVITGLVAAALVLRIRELAQRQAWGRVTYAAMALAFCLPPLLARVTYMNPDAVVRVLVLYLGLRWWDAWADRTDAESSGMTMLLAALTIVMKLSGGVVGAVAMAALGLRGEWRRHARVIALASMLGVIWCGRSVWMSGALIYPVPATVITRLPWSDLYWTRTMEGTVKAYARAPQMVEPGTGLPLEKAERMMRSPWQREWFGIWKHSLTLLGSMFLVAAFGVILLLTRTDGLRQEPAVWVPVMGMMAGLIFWWNMAPDPRFGEGAMLGLGALLLSAVAGRFCGHWIARVPARGWVLLIAMAVGINCAARQTWSWQFNDQVQVPPYTELVLDDGTKARHALIGPGLDRCWDLPLPCSPGVMPEALIRRAQPYCLRELTKSRQP